LNDPRVFFAAERTLLAWNRTSIALIAFGFVIERASMVLELLGVGEGTEAEASARMWLGIAFLALGAFVAIASSLQYRQVLRTLKPAEIPVGYFVSLAPLVNLCVALLGTLLVAYVLWAL
jgi:putative membrane protein